MEILKNTVSTNGLNASYGSLRTVPFRMRGLVGTSGVAGDTSALTQLHGKRPGHVDLALAPDSVPWGQPA
ncbi:hypothetical protein DNL40_00935 [Xylanimonas oleitrophica]|uniref:Uncharacterized protein n=1 Tax=Xylanimonas oleitrophica TaxID=2607479 RepID=A0A2W5X2D5_9MICO|nr:hypothetical protein DNL40_00935 [Xylanimonas oleitrophica]